MDSQVDVAEREAPVGPLAPGDYVRVDARQLGDHLLLVVAGEADHFSAPAMGDALRCAVSPATRSVAVEVSGLSFCDLAGLRALHGFCVDARSRQMPVMVHGMSPLLRMLSDAVAPLPRAPAH